MRLGLGPLWRTVLGAGFALELDRQAPARVREQVRLQKQTSSGLRPSGAARLFGAAGLSRAAYVTVLVLGILAMSCGAGAQTFVPFPIATAWPTTSPLNRSFSPIDPESARLVVQDGHFVRAGQRLRILGVNTITAGNFPPHDQAERIAFRLASAGVNCVRFHHLDTLSWPSGIWNEFDGRTLKPQALERLDYFIDQLARHGICADINLHVGREYGRYLGLPDSNTSYGKVVSLFVPDVIAAMKDYARQLFTHVNPYRGKSYADDPAVALVEISNENSFFMPDAEDWILGLPSYYIGLLRQQFTIWLRSKYGTTAALSQAWGASEPLGTSCITNGDFRTATASGAPAYWALEQHSSAVAAAEAGNWKARRCVRLAVTNCDLADWHLQFKQTGLAVVGQHYYTVSFAAAADTSRTIGCGVQMDLPPNDSLGLSRTLKLGPDWTTFTLGFNCNADESNARLRFSIGQSGETVYLADVMMRPGGQRGLTGGESLETSVALYLDLECAQRTVDRMRFLAETEKAFFSGVRDYLRNELGCRAPVTGTTVYGPLGAYAQSDMDFIDSHAYWKHPQFPRTPWDPVDWYMEQKAMTDDPGVSTLAVLACQRISGRPLTVSEYSHPAPNDYQAECVPLLASFAAAQDWDGIWLFEYGNRSATPDRTGFSSYFDIEQNPAKWGFMRPAAAIFRDGAIPALEPLANIPLTGNGDPLQQLVEHHLRTPTLQGTAAFVSRLGWQHLLGTRIELALHGNSLPVNLSPGVIEWTSTGGRGFFAAKSEKAVCFAGHSSDFITSTCGMLTLTNPPFAAVTLTSLDGLPFSTSRIVLLAGCGQCENVGMGFSPDRTTVGNSWGTGPVHVQPLEGVLSLPERNWTCRALSADGIPAQSVPVTLSGNRTQVSLSASHGTMWYLLTAEPAYAAALDFQWYE